jgi:hypothetical protein
MNTIQEKWDIFEKNAIPSNALEPQRKAMQLAFYAGAAAMEEIAITACSPSVSEDAGVEILVGCNEEIRAYAAAFDTKKTH